MKWVFFLLLAANLGYFFLADEPQPGPPPPIPPPAPAGQVANILLLSEATQRGLYPLSAPPAIAPPSVVRPEQPAPDPEPDPEKQTVSAPVAAPAPPASPPVSPPTPAKTPQATAAPPAPGAESEPESAPEPEPPPSETNTVPPSVPATPDSRSGPAQPAPATNAPTDVAAERPAEPLATPAKAPEPPSAPRTDDQTTATAAGEEGTNDTPSPSVEPPPVATVATHGEHPPIAAAENGKPQADAPLKCHRMGPFKRAPEVSAVRTRARKLGLDGRILRSTQQTPKRYRIYLGPYETTKTLEFDQRELEANGYNGVTVSQNNQLSTLVIARFDTRPQAKPLLAELRKLGYKPRISQEYRRLTRYYLVLPPATTAKSTQATEQLEADFPAAPLTPVDCPRPPNT